MDKERYNFLFGAAARQPGKRQIKPNAAFFEQQQLMSAYGAGDDDEEEDEDVIFPSPNSTDNDDSEQEEDGQGQEEQQQSSTNDDEEEEGDGETGGNSTDDEDSGGNGAMDAAHDGAGRPSTSNDIDKPKHIIVQHKKKGTVNRNNGNKLNGLMSGADFGKTNKQNGKALSAHGMDSAGGGVEVQHQQQQLCAVCLNLRPADHCGELIQCDRCAIFVHELCYGAASAAVVVVAEEESADGNGGKELSAKSSNKIGAGASSASLPMVVSTSSSTAAAAATPDTQSVVSSASTEPWFCEPCLFGVRDVPPHCELCPSRYGAFKRTIGGGSSWVHVQCAAFTPGVRFADPETLSAVIWRDIDTRAFGRKACAGCCSTGGAAAPRQLIARTGITVRCDAGMCRHFYHVTCAQRLGLLIDLESEAVLGHRHQNHHNQQQQRGGNVLNQNHGRANDSNATATAAPTGGYGGGSTVLSAATVTASAASSVVVQHQQQQQLRHHHHSTSSSAEVGYLYCEKHAPRDASVSRMRIAYAKFAESEERRMAANRWNRVVAALELDARQERKRAAQLRDYEQRMRRLLLPLPPAAVAEGDDGETKTNIGATDTAAPTATTVGQSQRRAKLLHTNARFLNEFAEKHELLGLDGSQFAEEFSVVPAAQLPSNLTPAFSKTFVSYVEHRDMVGLPGESERFELLNRQLAQRQQQQREAEHELEQSRKLCTDVQRTRADQQRLVDRCRAVLVKLAPAAVVGTVSPNVPQSSSSSLLQLNNVKMMMMMTSCSSSASVLPAETKKSGNSIGPIAADTNATTANNNNNTIGIISNKKAATKRKRSPKSPEILSSLKNIISSAVVPSSHSPTSNQHHYHHQQQHKNLPAATKTKMSPTNAFIVVAAHVDVVHGQQQQQLTTTTTEQHILATIPHPPLQCHKCKKTTDAHLLAYCDTCKCHYHIGCLDPPLAKMPAKSKFSRFECSDCACPSETDGEEDGGGATGQNNGADALPAKRECVKMSSPSSASAEHWSLLQNRPKRERRTPRASNSFIGIA